MRRRTVPRGCGALLGVAIVGVVIAGVAPTSVAAPDSAAPGSAALDTPARSGVPTHLPAPDRVREKRIADFTRAVVLRSGDPIVVANLTVPPGRYLITYAFDGSLTNAGVPARLRCGLIDANGVDRFIAEDPVTITAGTGWQRMTLAAVFSLPEVTLGVRCEPTRPGLVLVGFRDVWIAAIRIAD